jgi:hypothetical protein
MTKDELIAEITKHEEIVPTADPNTFLKRREAFKNLHAFFRPVADDCVIMAWLLNYSTAEANATGPRILDFAQAARDQFMGRVTTKLPWPDSGFPQFDHFIALGPEHSTSPPLREAFSLVPAIVACGIVNACEFMGDEDVVELRARLRNVSIGDIQRNIEPAANSRFRFDNGTKSKQKFLAVTRHKELEADIGKLQKLGGVVELENYERVGCVLLGKAGQSTIEVTLEGEARTVPAERSVKFLDVFLRQGVEAARKEL